VPTLGEQVVDDAEVAVLLQGRQLDRPFQEAAGLIEVVAVPGGPGHRDSGAAVGEADGQRLAGLNLEAGDVRVDQVGQGE
jgi:hypothetical protein